MERPDWAPNNVDIEKASAARLYDYFLGGGYNFAVDRALGRQIEQAAPSVPEFAFLNRAYLRRAVRYLVSRGIDQFLDLGSGIPSIGNVHDIAHGINPNARVVYVDNEPVAVKASELLLADTPYASIVKADLRDPDSVLAHPTTRAVLDLRRPVAVMLVSVMHFVADDDEARDIVRRYVDAVPSGSCVAISHGSGPGDDAEEVASMGNIVNLYAKTSNPAMWRRPPVIETLFAGTELVDPGLVHVLDWHPDDDRSLDGYRSRIGIHVGVGRKP